MNTPEGHEIVGVGGVQSGEAFGTPTIQMKTHFWLVWMKIAIRHEHSARDARAEALRLDRASSGSEFSVALEREMEAAMVAVAACAHALDALYGVIAPMAVDDETRSAWQRNKTARDRRIFETLKAGFEIAERAQHWSDELEWLFDRRDAAVHPEERWETPAPHPTGTNVSGVQLTYSLEAVERALTFVTEVLQTCFASPRSNRPEVVAWAEAHEPTELPPRDEPSD
jgi:hypothetical protein